MCNCFGAVAHGSAPTRSVGRWSNVLHTSAFLLREVRFEVVFHARLGMINRAAGGSIRGKG